MRLLASFILYFTLTVVCGTGLVLSGMYLYLNPQIPDAAQFKNVKFKAPLRIYSADNKLIQEFGERLTPVVYEEIPPLFIKALLDTEDKRYFEHNGVDLITLANASWQLIRNKGSIRTGASTITMQLVKNISGDTEVRFTRKFKEMLLALKLERELSKQEILTLYLNIIPFGKHAFGIKAAAQTYYGKNPEELNLAQLAMLAGIPQAPEAGNPINGPERAFDRRNLILSRMLEQASITEEAFEIAVGAPITASVYGRDIELQALYVAEMVRKQLLTDYGSDAYSQGLIVHTTIDSNKQLAAEAAITKKLNEYDRRHGYRGPEHRSIQGTSEYRAAPEYGYPANWVRTLENAKVLGDQHPAIVLSTGEKSMTVVNQSLTVIELDWGKLSWARPYIDVDTRGPRPKTAAEIADIGDLIRINQHSDGSWALGQVPGMQAALVALNPRDGAIKSMVGGYHFTAQQYNHATQARRQPGSNFKPFFYAGALEAGNTAATIYNDAPVVLPGGELEQVYRPSNWKDEFEGDLRLRQALFKSKNLVSLRVILTLGAQNAIDYVSRFGFDTSNFPVNVQLAFGGGTIALTPLEVATGYAAFANGGYKVEPYFISKIESINSDVLFTATPQTACNPNCTENQVVAKRIIEPRVAYIMDSILLDVMRRGTGTKATRELKRRDIRGKTGTTNDADIWFSGYTPDLVVTTWAGYDNNSSVGSREFGSTTPIESWIEFMRVALPVEADSSTLSQPNGLVTVRINPTTGLRAAQDDPDAIFEIFREEFAPAPELAKKEDKKENTLQQIF
ncbi:MAG: penicillin-binding protein 1A [Candidatus Azotimanducaceae bacterium]|jgi:penicillin-binding protein 1A